RVLEVERRRQSDPVVGELENAVGKVDGEGDAPGATSGKGVLERVAQQLVDDQPEGNGPFQIRADPLARDREAHALLVDAVEAEQRLGQLAGKATEVDLREAGRAHQ